MKIVINKGFGGFSLSNEFCEELIKMGWSNTTHYEYDEDAYELDQKMKNYTLVKVIFVEEIYDEDYGCKAYEYVYADEIKLRTHQDAIEVFEKLGSEKSSGEFSELKIVDIPDDVEYTIEDSESGIEWVAEKHRVWS